MTNDYREIPIVRNVLPHTGKLDGDDTGYRDVTVHESDQENPDSLVVLDAVRTCPIYANGAVSGITPFYPVGLGASPIMLVRLPVEMALVEADKLLKPYDMALLVVDAWRSATVQAALWRDVFMRLVRADSLAVGNMTSLQWVTYGRRADDTASFCRVVSEDRRYEQVRRRLFDMKADELGVAARELGTTVDGVVDELITFMGNHNPDMFTLDTTATTAHGGGGACDIWLVESGTAVPCNLGVPFDSTDPSAVMDFFEQSNAFERYCERVAADAAIRENRSQLTLPDRVTPKEVEDIRANRRVLFHAMREVGATFFSLGSQCGEPWHFNFGNERRGRQRDLFPNAGSECHSLLRNIRDPKTNDWVAVWGNETAHRQAAEILRTA